MSDQLLFMQELIRQSQADPAQHMDRLRGFLTVMLKEMSNLTDASDDEVLRLATMLLDYGKELHRDIVRQN